VYSNDPDERNFSPLKAGGKVAVAVQGNLQPDDSNEDYSDDANEIEEDLHIEISKSQRIDETIENLKQEHKTRFAGLLIDYIEHCLDKGGNSGEKPLFEVARERAEDKDSKFKLIKAYNALLDELAHNEQLQEIAESESIAHYLNVPQKVDLGIACDLLLDLLRYEDADIMNATIAVHEHDTAKRKNST